MQRKVKQTTSNRFAEMMTKVRFTAFILLRLRDRVIFSLLSAQIDLICVQQQVTESEVCAQFRALMNEDESIYSFHIPEQSPEIAVQIREKSPATCGSRQNKVFRARPRAPKRQTEKLGENIMKPSGG